MISIRIIPVIAYLVIGLFVGAAFSEHISMNLAATEWANLWTYGWIILWPFFLAFKFFLVFLILAVVGGLAMLAFSFWEPRR